MKMHHRLKSFISTGKGKAVSFAALGSVLLIAGIVAIAVSNAKNGGAAPRVTSLENSRSASDVFVAAAAQPTSSGISTSSGTTTDVKSITLSKKAITLRVGDKIQDTYSILPSNATNVSVSWDSSNRSIADIDTSCTITAKSAGTAIIKVTASNGLSDSCAVIVKGTAAGKTPSPSSTKSESSAPAIKYSSNNAAGIASFANYGFPHGVRNSNAQTIKKGNWNYNTMVNDVMSGIVLGDTVNYRSIPGDYKSKMEYYWGAASGGQAFATAWINEVSKYHIIETCTFDTSINNIYQDTNGEMLVRGKQTITVTSADAGFFKEMGVSGTGIYYRIIDVIVATGGQNGYGIPQSKYSINGEYKLTKWLRQ